MQEKILIEFVKTYQKEKRLLIWHLHSLKTYRSLFNNDFNDSLLHNNTVAIIATTTKFENLIETLEWTIKECQLKIDRLTEASQIAWWNKFNEEDE